VLSGDAARRESLCVSVGTYVGTLGCRPGWRRLRCLGLWVGRFTGWRAVGRRDDDDLEVAGAGGAGRWQGIPVARWT